MSLWRRLADRLLPAETFAGFGMVNYAAADPTDIVTRTIFTHLLNDAVFGWVSPRGFRWQPWPNPPRVWDLFPVMSTTMSPIRYLKP